MSKNKSLSDSTNYTIWILLGLILTILFIILGGWSWKQHIINKMDQESNLEMLLPEQSQYVCDAAKLVKVLQEKNILVDQEYIDELQKKEQFIIGSFETISSSLNIDTMGTILYLNEHYNNGMSEKILQHIDNYYIRKNKLFSMYPIEEENYLEIKKDELENVQYTQMFLEALGDKKEIVSKYKLEEGLADWFNQNAGNTSNEKVKSTLEEVFWYFYDNNELDMIEYEKVKNIIKSDVENAKKYVKEEKKANMTKALWMQEIDCYLQLFEKDNSYQEKVTETFNQIQTLEQLEYEKTDKACLFVLTDFLKDADNPENLDFIKDVINDCLKENFHACLKDE